MFGIEIPELLALGKQLGFALAGAASLWALIFARLRHKEVHGKDCLVFDWIARRLMIPFLAGAALAAVSWMISLFTLSAHAHEGIIIEASVLQEQAALSLMTPVVYAWLAVTVLGLLIRQTNPALFNKAPSVFYGTQLLFISVLISMSVWTGSLFAKEQLFFIGHSIHSILTVGTVLILDFLFLASRGSTLLKQHVYPLFPPLSKAIWIGLAVEFASVALVFGEAISGTSKFLFMQTIIGILIINGVLLAGPIARRIRASVQKEGAELSPRWETAANVSGAVSVVSWLSITTVDVFAHLTLTYLELVGIYLAAIGMALVGHYLVERLEERIPFEVDRIFGR